MQLIKQKIVILFVKNFTQLPSAWGKLGYSPTISEVTVIAPLSISAKLLVSQKNQLSFMYDFPSFVNSG